MKKIVKAVGKVSTVAAIIFSALAPSIAVADNYPNKPINFVVGFGVGGSADRMTRSMAGFISEELGQPIKVINKKGAGTQISANYVLARPDDGYTVYASTFAPYLSNTILKGGAKYAVDDFSYINFQWFDQELIAANKDTPYKDLASLITAIKEKPKSVKAAVVQGSGGHLMAKLLLDKNGIPQENLNLVTFSSGGKARSAVAGGQVDFIIISAQGSEGIREFLHPLAVVSDKRSDHWNAPAVNEALKPLNTEVPVLTGSMRGFAVTKEFKEKFPQRYEKLALAIQKSLARKDVQKFLKASDIGGDWVGPEHSSGLMSQNYNTFKQYSNLLD
ncbi:Bug family tripartite tricarboxylate transporter substrate binding protein [Vibrio algarum]|uniref:Tripartite tricarboxylate transporter substrate binding protein n=1 Tax=Vibrio algarum TaxID=3020714 RepID=A0ABT4YU51_9VIBR|nr:tripartite tricarboxylate transporter substrate binding protein [Vibrio sp. KJ40-1]MDB1125104.1 tripartite tricarboxylate transporter substrate binding protein [Vibrio sp. KJ40-1]